MNSDLRSLVLQLRTASAVLVGALLMSAFIAKVAPGGATIG